MKYVKMAQVTESVIPSPQPYFLYLKQCPNSVLLFTVIKRRINKKSYKQADNTGLHSHPCSPDTEALEYTHKYVTYFQYTPILPSVPEMEGVHATRGHLFSRMYLDFLASQMVVITVDQYSLTNDGTNGGLTFFIRRSFQLTFWEQKTQFIQL